MKVTLVGGGTAGHVNPNFAVAELLQKNYPNIKLSFITSNQSFERSLFAPYHYDVSYITAGKLRRYFSLQNFIDPLKVFWGFVQSLRILINRSPDIVFMKGGFVCVPVAFACKILRIPFIIHESDASLGLANKIVSFLTNQVWYSSQSFRSPKPNYLNVKIPVKPSLKLGNPNKIPGFSKLTTQKPTLLIVGGSSGAKAINDFVFSNLNQLVKSYNIIHLTGKINSENIPSQTPSNYLHFDYVDDLKDIYACSDIVLSRAGAGSLAEFEFLGLPAVLVPLPVSQSRGDQLLNAQDFQARGLGITIHQDSLEIQHLLSSLQTLLSNYKPQKSHLDSTSQIFLAALNKVLQK